MTPQEHQKNVEASRDLIKAALKGLAPKIAIILGSGLGGLADKIEGAVVVEHTLAKAHNISVVMLARDSSRKLIPDHCGPNALNFVGRDRHTDAGTADQDDPLDTSGGNEIDRLPRHVREIDRLLRLGAKADHLVAMLGENGPDMRLHRKARVVGCKTQRTPTRNHKTIGLPRFGMDHRGLLPRP